MATPVPEMETSQLVLNYASINIKLYLADNNGVQQHMPGSPAERNLLMSKRDDWGRTLVHWATYYGRTRSANCMLSMLSQEEIFRVLKIQDSGGGTAVHCAAWRGHTRTLRSMLKLLPIRERMSVLEIPNEHCRTPLETAQYYNHVKIAEFIHRCIAEAESPAERDERLETRRDVGANTQICRLCKQDVANLSYRVVGRAEDQPADDVPFETIDAVMEEDLPDNYETMNFGVQAGNAVGNELVQLADVDVTEDEGEPATTHPVEAVHPPHCYHR